MSCCDPYGPYPEDTVGQCPKCGGDVDSEGKSTEESCFYSPIDCLVCQSRYCDGSC